MQSKSPMIAVINLNILDIELNTAYIYVSVQDYGCHLKGLELEIL